MHQRKTWWTTRVPMPMKQGRAETVMTVDYPLPNSWHPAQTITTPFLQCNKSVNNIWCESNCAPKQVLLLTKTIEHQNVSLPKASGDHYIPQLLSTTVERAKRYRKTVVFMRTHQPILSNNKYLMVHEAWKLTIESQNHQCTFAVAPGGTLSASELPGSPSFNWDLQI